MTAAVRTTAVGVFYDHAQAEKAVDDLRRVGYRQEQIGVAVRREKVEKDVPAGAPATRTEEGAGIGALAGGALGAAFVGVVATGLIPGLGAVIAANLLAGILGGVGAGAAAGGLVGALIGHGIPEEEARQYEKELAAGRTLVTVKADGRYDEAVAILRRHGAVGKGSPLV